MRKPSTASATRTASLVAFTSDVGEAFDAFENDAFREDTYPVCGFPKYGKRALDLFRMRPDGTKRSLEDATAFSIGHGLGSIKALGGRKALDLARETLLRSASDDVSMLEDWAYDLDARHSGHVPKLWTRLHEDVRRDCNIVASQIGISASCVCGLSIFATLIHADEVPGALRLQMRDELVAFGRQLKARAKAATHLAAMARPAGPTAATSFDDVLARIEA